MTKEQFIQIMESYLKQREITNEWLDRVDAAFHGAWEEIMDHSYETLFLNWVADMVGDTKSGWIWYFVGDKECQDFEILDKNDNVIKIDNLEKLYDLIKEGI